MLLKAYLDYLRYERAASERTISEYQADLKAFESFFKGLDSTLSWENLDTEHPLRRIKKIRSVVEVSAVTFPAYDSTDIYARSKEALESARSALENARQQRAAEVETSKKQTDNSLLLLKEQTKTLTLK